MKTSMTNNKVEFEKESTSDFVKPPLYNPEIGNESGFNYKMGEIKSHSFSVRDPRDLAGENIIFEPGSFNTGE